MTSGRLMLSSLFFLYAIKRRIFVSGAVKHEQCQRHCQMDDSLKTFLDNAKKAAFDNFKKFKTVHVVIGNEACDLDSTVSAIAFAFSKAQVNQMNDVIHIPVLNIAKEDFPLRNDVVYVLSQQRISDKFLTFRSDLDLRSLHLQGKLVLSLVDFHILPKTDELLEKTIVEIVDHRKQEKSFDKNVQVTVKPVGSCSTLVAAKLFSENFKFSHCLINLFYNTIIADTICMSETAGKKTEDDEVVIRRLEELEPNLAKMRQKIFDDILKARRDVSGLTLLELLRKDLKIVSSNEVPHLSVTMSTIEEDLKVFLERQEVEKNLKVFTEQHNASAAVLMFLSIGSASQLTRQLAVYSPNANLRQEICNVLETSNDPNLLLSKSVTSLDKNKFTVYIQGNKTASRKAVLPIIKTNLHKLSNFLSS